MDRLAVIEEKELQIILDNKSSKNTKKATELNSSISSTYLQSRDIRVDFTNINKSELNGILRKFYVEVRKQDGTH